ncbi:unnamed protein product, partial [Heterosigma akashiwo]
MVNYSNSKIYKIVCVDKNINEMYIGSTTGALSQRYRVHKSKSKHHPSRMVYQFINQNGGFDNFEIILIEAYPCNNVDELRKREEFYRRNYNSRLNSYVCYQTYQERLIHMMNYREKNKETIKSHKKKYYIENKETIKLQHKKYYEQNKEMRKSYQKQWYQHNK